MACGSCGGGGHPSPPLFVTADGKPYIPDGATTWELTYPNGAVQEFTQEWAAAQALAISGGVMKVLHPVPATPLGEPGTPDATEGASGHVSG